MYNSCIRSFHFLWEIIICETLNYAMTGPSFESFWMNGFYSRATDELTWNLFGGCLYRKRNMIAFGRMSS
jgi:hypothetical protein